nr:immunoglobulin heavy chain junction region [Macaca mulatta]MOV54614.1 immunoglobulin heavy chain junction region [Macaca mulatta]MOV55670.1 immunoglobulin heavy chain junction region [Macaca mulatta]MOV57138.1 immunoglobulin heavy chain junction region [Macaca mulatta]MOV58422.1 immunoglobulin heavy chain junction region [Macaca mulatta]
CTSLGWNKDRFDVW